MISNLHYISQGETPEEHLRNIHRICLAGADWVQLRLKDETLETVVKTARAAKEICDLLKVKLIINDYPEVAKQVDAHGIHLGKKDCCPLEARALLGTNKIIGGTANTLEDCEALCEKKVDYIGLGPFRFTTTKKDLSPVLRAEGYRKLLGRLHSSGKSIPVIAIGGITAPDVSILVESGVHGLAISGGLTSLEDPEKLLKEIQYQFLGKKL